MAEFDTAGFSAVSSFFGKAEPEESAPTASSAASRGRQGVGSSSLRKTEPSPAVDRLLKVGKRKRNDNVDDDDNESMSHDSVHEEEEGRTAIAEKSTKKTPPATNSTATETKKKKKKKGKKERKLHEAQNEDEQEAGDTKDETQAEETTTATAKRKKRHKVRSRQKNIYKDKRLAQYKPDHLIMGRATFRGRPLTAETRAKLNLPPSKSSRHRETAHHTQSNSESMGIKLAVEELFEVGDEAAVGDPKKESVKKKPKKKKRSRYKNLA